MPMLSRASVSALHSVLGHRTFSSKTAKFITLDAQGRLNPRIQVDVLQGDSHETYVRVPTEIGQAFRACGRDSISPINEPDTCHLTFHHDCRHFSYRMYLHGFALEMLTMSRIGKLSTSGDLRRSASPIGRKHKPGNTVSFWRLLHNCTRWNTGW